MERISSQICQRKSCSVIIINPISTPFLAFFAAPIKLLTNIFSVIYLYKMSSGTLIFPNDEEIMTYGDALDVLDKQKKKNNDEWAAEQNKKNKKGYGPAICDGFQSYIFSPDQKPGTFEGNVKEKVEDFFESKGKNWALVKISGCIDPIDSLICGWATVKDKSGHIIHMSFDDRIPIERTHHREQWIGRLVFMGRLNSEDNKYRRTLYEALYNKSH